MPRLRRHIAPLPKATPLPARLTAPVLRQFVTEQEWASARGQNGGERLEAIATPRWQAEVDGWFRGWCSSWPHVEPELVDYDTAQRAAREQGTTDEFRFVDWCHRVSVGVIGPKWSSR